MLEKEEGAVWDEGRALNLETLLILQKVNNFRHHCTILFKIKTVGQVTSLSHKNIDRPVGQ